MAACCFAGLFPFILPVNADAGTSYAGKTIAA